MKNLLFFLSLIVLMSPVMAQKKKESTDQRLAGLDEKFQTLLAEQ
jgi:hypothetical protein